MNVGRCPIPRRSRAAYPRTVVGPYADAIRRFGVTAATRLKTGCACLSRQRAYRGAGLKAYSENLFGRKPTMRYAAASINLTFAAGSPLRRRVKCSGPNGVQVRPTRFPYSSSLSPASSRPGVRHSPMRRASKARCMHSKPGQARLRAAPNSFDISICPPRKLRPAAVGRPHPGWSPHGNIGRHAKNSKQVSFGRPSHALTQIKQPSAGRARQCPSLTAA